MVTFLHYFFGVHIGYVHVTRGMHPATVFVKTLINKKLAPRHSSVSVQSFFAHHLHFRTKIERYVGINVQNGVARSGFGRRKCKAIGTRLVFRVFGYNNCGGGIARIKVLQFSHCKLSCTDGPNAAIRPKQLIPRLKFGQKCGLDLRIFVQIIIDTVGVSIQQFLHPRLGFVVIGNGLGGINQQLDLQIIVQSRLTFELSGTAQFLDVIEFYAFKIIFALRIQQSKNRISVGFAINMRNSPIVTNNGHSFGLLLVAGNFGRREFLSQ